MAREHIFLIFTCSGVMKRRIRTLIGLSAILVLLAGSVVTAQQPDAGVPLGLQAAMIKKIYTYLNVGQPLKVCVVGKSQDVRSKAEGQLKQIGVVCEVIEESQSPASDCSVVLLLPDVSKGAAKKIAAAKKIIFSTDKDLISDGCCIGIGVVLDNGRPQILLNITKLDGLGVRPDPNFISKMAKII